MRQNVACRVATFSTPRGQVLGKSFSFQRFTAYPPNWQCPCSQLESGRGVSMLESTRKTVALPRFSSVFAEVVLSAGVILTFLWLLIEDRIHPFAVYLAQLYLTL
jgi:hypothetical protein